MLGIFHIDFWSISLKVQGTFCCKAIFLELQTLLYKPKVFKCLKETKFSVKIFLQFVMKKKVKNYFFPHLTLKDFCSVIIVPNCSYETLISKQTYLNFL